jgi:hypothetical protein
MLISLGYPSHILSVLFSSGEALICHLGLPLLLTYTMFYVYYVCVDAYKRDLTLSYLSCVGMAIDQHTTWPPFHGIHSATCHQICIAKRTCSLPGDRQIITSYKDHSGTTPEGSLVMNKTSLPALQKVVTRHEVLETNTAERSMNKTSIPIGTTTITYLMEQVIQAVGMKTYDGNYRSL